MAAVTLNVSLSEEQAALIKREVDAGNYVSATFNIAAETPAGSVVMLVKSGNELAALTGALRMTGRPRSRAVQ